jgi:hypothetical protein
MKNLFFVIAMFFVGTINSQVLRIKVYEIVQYINYDTVGVLSATSSMREIINIKRVNCEYVIDLTNKTDKFFRNGVLESEADITFVNDGSLFIINFLYEGFDVGVVINTDIQNETFDWFSKIGNFYDISKATDFEIVKSQ